jgi:hypothetical protein
LLDRILLSLYDPCTDILRIGVPVKKLEMLTAALVIVGGLN